MSVEKKTLSSEPATAASRLDRYKALNERMKNEMENEIKSFLQEKNQPHLKKSRQFNIQEVAGKNFIEHGIIDHLKEEKKQTALVS